MSDINQEKVNGKILFGIDFLHIMRFMELPNQNENFDKDKQAVVDAVARLLLLQWDFTIEEIDKANKLFWEKVNSETFNEPIREVIDRIVNFLEGKKQDQEKFFLHFATVAIMDDTYISNERFMTEAFQSEFDFRPSEVDEFFKKGWAWRVAFDYLGDTYFDLAQEKH